MGNKLRWLMILAVGLLFTTGLPPAPVSAATAEWQWAAPLPQGEHLYAVTYGDDQFVAVGASGAVVASPNGKAWTVRPSWTRQALLGVAHGEGRFVAVGAGGAVLTSVDGSTWVQRESGVTEQLSAVTYDGAVFIAVGAKGTILLSEDGLKWHTIPSPADVDLLAVTSGGGRLVAVGRNGVALTSANGKTWEINGTGPFWDLYAVGYGEGSFLAVGAGGTMATSPDGVSWSQLAPAETDLWAVAYAHGRFYTFGGHLTATADEGQLHMQQVPADILGAASGAGALVAVGLNGAMLHSDDGKVWHSLGSPVAPELRDLIHDGGRFVLVARDGIYTSSEGSRWSQAYEAHAGVMLSEIAYGNGEMLVITNTNVGLFSGDGATWKQVAVGPGTKSAVAYGEGRFVAVGENVATSRNGADWEEAAGPGEWLVEVAAGDGQFVAISDAGTLFTSADGLSWTKQTTLKERAFTALVYGGGVYLAAGTEGRVYTSANGVNWKEQEGPGGSILTVVYDGERFVAAGAGGALAVSRNGSHWQQITTGTRIDLMAAARGDDRYVLAGRDGAVLVKEGAFDPFTCGNRFADVDGTHPACYAIELLEAYRIINGYPDGLFRPHQSVTRAEFAKLLVLSTGQRPNPEGTVLFADAQDHWAAAQGFLQPAVKVGALQGFPDGLLRPDAELTRAQAVKIAVAAAGVKVQGGPGSYLDVADASWYADHVATAVTMHLIGPEAPSSLWDGPVFRGDEPVTRAEAAMLLANLRQVRQ